MEFSGTFEIEGVTTEEVWLALSDPVLIGEALPGCEFIVDVSDRDEDEVDFDELREEHADAEPPATLPEADADDIAERAFVEGGVYAAEVGVKVGSVSATFETLVTITDREFPEMAATGEGNASNSSFEMESWMSLEETDDGVAVDWEAEADVFGRVAQMGARVMNPVANRLVGRFFNDVADRVSEVQESSSSGLSDRVRNLL